MLRATKNRDPRESWWQAAVTEAGEEYRYQSGERERGTPPSAAKVQASGNFRDVSPPGISRMQIASPQGAITIPVQSLLGPQQAMPTVVGQLLPAGCGTTAPLAIDRQQLAALTNF